MNLTINGLPITVDSTAVEEIIRRHLLNGSAPDPLRAFDVAAAARAHIGNIQLQKGEVRIGSYAGPDGKTTIAILLPQKKEMLDFDAALAWSRSQLPEGKSDAPNRIEALLLFLHHRALFKKDDVLWTNEQYAAFSGNAWGQYFYYGTQDYWYEGHELLARAVRRVAI